MSWDLPLNNYLNNHFSEIVSLVNKLSNACLDEGVFDLIINSCKEVISDNPVLYALPVAFKVLRTEEQFKSFINDYAAFMNESVNEAVRDFHSELRHCRQFLPLYYPDSLACRINRFLDSLEKEKLLKKK